VACVVLCQATRGASAEPACLFAVRHDIIYSSSSVFVTQSSVSFAAYSLNISLHSHVCATSSSAQCCKSLIVRSFCRCASPCLWHQLSFQSFSLWLTSSYTCHNLFFCWFITSTLYKAPSTPATMSKQRSTLSKESFDMIVAFDIHNNGLWHRCSCGLGLTLLTFLCRLKTYVFYKSFPSLSLYLTSRNNIPTGSSELYWFLFPVLFVVVFFLLIPRGTLSCLPDSLTLP